jgi:hypothetical protein
MSYLERRPVGWREDDRTFKLLQSWGFKGKPTELFVSLDPIYNRKEETPSNQVNMKSFQKSSLFSKLLSAKGGKDLGLNEDVSGRSQEGES